MTLLGKRLRADDYFAKAKDEFVQTRLPHAGPEQVLCAKLLTKGRERLKLTFHSEIRHQNSKSIRAIKPDFMWWNEGIYYFFELCGSWQNFHQKRFQYLGPERGVKLAFYERNQSDSGWHVTEEICEFRVIYMLRDDPWLQVGITRGPKFPRELFTFNFDDWSSRPEPIDFEYLCGIALSQEQVGEKYFAQIDGFISGRGVLSA